MPILPKMTVSRPTELSPKLVELLRPDFRVEPVPDGQVTAPAIHVPTGIRFRLIPGGLFEMGLTEEDKEYGSEVINWTPTVARYVEERYQNSLPTRLVEVSPFLCSQSLLGVAELKALGLETSSAELERSAAIEVANRRGFRLPSEAELEWVARDGRDFCFPYNWPLTWRWEAMRLHDEPMMVHEESQFGVSDLCALHWAADDWHPTYQGAPEISKPWMGGDPCGVLRLGINFFISDSEEDFEDFESAFLAIRRPGATGSTARLRLALDVPEGLRGLRLV